MDLQLKDWLTLGISSTALMVAGFSFFYANIYKPANAILTLLSRSGDPESWAIETDMNNVYKQERKLISKAKTNLSYSLSNTGKQALCVKSVEVLRGPSRLGNLRDPRGFLVLNSTDVSSFVIEPGDIKVVNVTYENESERVDTGVDKYRLFSIEIVSADGSRFQICHDITKVMGSGAWHERIWDSCNLGAPVRSGWYV
ncbi:hypothetical protein [Pseudomonas viridiflava]|uniref:hypothetical protein n=1 Tax=Pseudomonas viridiflava TaxID=33069 RepID=UPI0013DBBCEE|nr:hypothetical protein [Pseudomonas viridiflava]